MNLKASWKGTGRLGQNYIDIYKGDTRGIRGKGPMDRNAEVAEMRRQQMEAYGPVDEWGGTNDFAPNKEIAPHIQFQHERAVQAYNAQKAKDAVGWFQRGMGNMESYRPGGAAAMQSGMYQGAAQGELAGRLEPLDMMFEWRSAEQHKARAEMKKAALTQAAGTVIGGVVGAFAGGPVGAMAGAAAGGALGRGIAGGGGGGGESPASGGSGYGAPGQEITAPYSPSGGPEGAGPTRGGSGGGTIPAGQGTGAGAGATYGAGSGIQGPGPSSRPAGAAGARVEGGQGGGGENPMSMGGPAGGLTPMGMGLNGFSGQAVADSYEARYGQPADTTWANYYAEGMSGFSDYMLYRQTALMAEDHNA